MIVFLSKNVYLLFMYYLQYRITKNQQIRLAKRLFEAYLRKDYVFHLQRNTADLLRNATDEVRKVTDRLLAPMLILCAELLVVLSITGLLLFVTPTATLFIFVFLASAVLLFVVVFRKKIHQLGKEEQKSSGQMIQWINQGFGAIKEIKILGRESFFIQGFHKYSLLFSRSARYHKMMLQVPRLYIETIVSITILLTIMMIAIIENNLTALLSTLGVFVMAAFRLMPSFNRILTSITEIRYHVPALEVIYEDLVVNKIEKTIEKSNPTGKQGLVIKQEREFYEGMELKHIYYKYPLQREYVLEDISLRIPIGQSVAIIGESGAGKSTLMDLMLGLLTPDSGSILVDGKKLREIKGVWQKKVGYIPQSIYLSDDTIRNNVTLGIPEDQIHEESVWRALEMAQLKVFVEQLPDQLETYVGERGVRLSGGQRQRIGIARALYHNPEILFFDEATSALDYETETEIIKAVDALKGEKTLIVIAHRLSTIENSDRVYKLHNGRLVGA